MEPIAITGFSFRLPQGAENESSFWDILVNGKNVMTEWPKSRANIDAFYHAQPNPKNTLYSRGAHFLKGDPGAFDAPFFSTTADEAASMDPQQRWLLEASYRAMENAGIPVEKAAGTDAAVFVGSMSDDYAKLIYKDPDEAPSNTSSGTAPALLANRLSWYFDLRGPSIQVNTACSSSMIATDLACQCLRNGQAPMALVAGSNTIFTPEESLHLGNMNFLSPDGRSYSFDHRGNGYARGEGVVVLVLKRLGDSLRDGDMIRAVIRASASNQDGHTPGITQPNVTAQENLIRNVYKGCGFDFRLTRYVEAHGTGTKLGDSTEAKALGRVFKTARSPKEPLYIGSVKSNIGHLEGASGLVGMLKAIMILERGIIPPNAVFEKWNPKINPKLNNIEVPTSSIPWPTEGLRRISVNSFGFGGSNSHVILDDAFHVLESLDSDTLLRIPASFLNLVPKHRQRLTNGVARGFENANSVMNNNDTIKNQIEVFHRQDGYLQEPKTDSTSSPEISYNGSIETPASGSGEDPGSASPPQRFRLLIWSAKDEAGLERMLESYKRYWEQHANHSYDLVERLAYTLSARRSLMPWRAYATVTDQPYSDDIKLSPSKGVRSSKETGLAFVFTGQGAQYANMVLKLLAYPVFRNIITYAGNVLRDLGADWVLLDELNHPERIRSPEKSQPLCTALQIALVELLQEFGVIPDAVVGHSSGEIVAAYTIGALSLESALKVAYHRGRLSQRLVSRRECMMSVNVAEADIGPYLEKVSLAEDIFVSCINSPLNVTVSGEESAIHKLRNFLKKDSVFTRKLPVGVAYHSPAMQQIAEEYLLCLGSLESRELTRGNAGILMASSVTGLGTPTSAFSKSQYWVDNLVSPVRFADALQYLAVAGPRIDGLKAISTYIEIGPYGALKRPVMDTLSGLNLGKKARYLPVLSRIGPPVKSTLETIGQLFAHGHQVSVLSANQQNTDYRKSSFLVDTPEYPFNHSQVYWHETRLSYDWRLRQAAPRTVLGVPVTDWNPLEPRWRKMLRISDTPWLEDHTIAGDVLFPAAGSMGMALEAVKQMAPASQTIIAFRIKEAVFLNPIIIRASRDTEVITRLRPLKQGYEKAALRFEVGLFTIVNGNWSECFKSTIHIEYHEPPNDVDIENVAHSATQAQKYARAKEKCRRQITKRNFYGSLADQGLQYGKTFSLVEDINWDNELAIAHVKTEPPVEPYEGVVHPGVLDAAFQVCYVAPTDGMSTKLPTTIPYKIRNAWISATGWQYPHTRQLEVLTTSKLRQLGTGIECSIDVLSDHRLPLCRVDKLYMRPIMSTESNHERSSKLLHRLDWKPDLSLLSPDQLQLMCGINRPVSKSSPGGYLCDLEKVLRSIFRYQLSPILETDWEKAPPHMKWYVSFLQSHLEHVPEDPLETSERTLNDKLEELVAGRSSCEIFSEICKNLLSIVRGDIDASQLLLSTSLAQNYCEDLLSSFDDHRLQSYLELAIHQNPGLRILEIGGGSGALTNLILPILEQIEQRVEGVAYCEYIFTDQSESNCQQARERFGHLSSRIKFKAFGIFQNFDPEQYYGKSPFKPAEFDIVLVGGALYNTRNLVTKLEKLRPILKPGGHLILCEATIPDDFAMNFALGVLPDWWREPLLTTSNSDAVLRENGFSGHDMVIRGSVLHPLSIVVSTAIDIPHETIDSAQTFLVVKERDEYQMAIALALIRDAFNSPKDQPRVITLAEIPDTQIGPIDCVLFLADMGKSTGYLLTDMSDSIFQRIRSLVQRSSNILWISSSEKGPFPDPGFDPYVGIKDGFLRTLRSEFSTKRLISLTLEAPPLDTPTTVSHISKVYTSAFIEKSPELEYVEQFDQILTSRLIGDTYLNYELSSSIRPETRSAPWLPGPPLKLDIGRRGQLDTLRFIEDTAYYEELGPTDVEIEAKAWSVNFRDVFSALGRLDDPGLGLDCAGIVTRVGASCSSVQPGDRVCMCVVDCMRMYPRSDEKVVAQIPPSLTFEEACAFTVPTLTAWHSLVEIARISKEDKVLIHAASGATGQLAIQVAQNAGAKVFATVGYDHKKQLLIDHYGIPSDHIFYSRSDNVTFAQGIMTATGGYGVDVVLNSLVGEGLRASWECIAPYGRFVEIGKVDINENSSLPMAPFAANATFASVDVRHMLLHRKEYVKKLLDQMMTMIVNGSIQYPKPLHTYDVSAAEDVFRYIQSGKNSGRAVIRIEPNAKVQKHLITRRTWRFDENASYLVAGGLGGIGRSILKWMASSRGAKNLIVPSRSGPVSTIAAQVVRELEEKGVKVSTPKCDVSSYTSLSRTLEECAKTLPPIKGCINASMALNDSVFENMSFTQWDNTIRSKVATSWNLHSLLPTDPEFMIFLSSVSGIIGNQGQSNYAAGCTFQDSLAQFRSRRGKKTVSIDLGAMHTIGVIAESEALQNHFENATQGLGKVEEYELLALLDIICDPTVNADTTPSQIVMGIGVPAEFLARSLEPPETMQRPLFAYFNQASSSSPDGIANFAAQFRQAETAADRSSLVTHSLATRLARALSIDPEDIDTGKPLHAFGVDSLVAVELRNWIAKEFLAEVPVSELVGRKTVEDVGELVEKSSQIRITV
ncbi:polyketide synthase PksD [Nemania sp. FL0031]|nr:polyketide synthase PksD [Nemania sp. FL0031]